MSDTKSSWDIDNKSERAKLLKKPWSMADVMRERKAAEKRKQIVERFKKQWGKR